jgi:Methyltransferase domain
VGSSPIASTMTSIQWLDDETARIDDVQFVCRTLPRTSSTPDRFFLAKRPDLVSRYARLLEDHNPSTMVELGVLQGGSTAFAALAHHPGKLMAFERSPDRIEALDILLERKALTSTVHVHYDVDQADRTTLHDRLDAEGIGTTQAIDLVVDDASHLVEPTRASFETLFPFLRPGGIYIVEDWAWAHVGYGLHRPDERPLSAFVLEATFAAAGRPDVVAHVSVDRDWASITRGPAALPTDGSFRVRDLYNGRSHDMLQALDTSQVPSPQLP